MSVETEPPLPDPTEAQSPESQSFFQRADWLSFAVTALLTFAVYLFTLNPSIDLDFSGIHTTGAMYLGVPHVPGFPLWTIYGYLFTLLPISNAAWRVSMAAAFASALTCGMVALVTSRCSGRLLQDLGGFRPMDEKAEKLLRIFCGLIAGLALGLDGMFWGQAVRGVPWNFSLMLLMVALSFFLRWQYAPEKMRWFYAACFTYGLTLTNSQALLAAALGIGILILSTKPELARDLFVVAALIIALLLTGARFDFLPDILGVMALFGTYAAVGTSALIIAGVLVATTRGIFGQWRAVIFCSLCFLIGLLPYFLIVVFSTANPPMNWGYPRTYDGFMHVLSRGQYEVPNPVESFHRMGECLLSYGIQTARDFGLLYFCAALISFLCLFRFQKKQRQWLFGLLALYLSLSVFLVYVLNPDIERPSLESNGRFYPASHMIISILAGCGMAVVGYFVSTSPKHVFRKRQPASHS